MEILFPNPLHSEIYNFAWFLESNRQVPKISKTVAKCCVTTTSQQSSSSSEGNPCRLWTLQFFHRFHLHLFKVFSHQLNDQTVSDSLIGNLLLHLINHDHPLKTFKDQINADAEGEEMNKKWLNFFTETEIDTSSETEISPKLRYFSNPKIFLNQPATQFSTLKTDADEISCVQKDTFEVNYARSDYLSTYTASLPRQNPSTKAAKMFMHQFNLIQWYHILTGIFTKKNKLKNLWLTIFLIFLGKTSWFQKPTNLHKNKTFILLGNAKSFICC